MTAPAVQSTGTAEHHPAVPALLAPYLSVGDEGYVLWCGPKETAELMAAADNLETGAALDYADMRRMQANFIRADQHARALAEALEAYNDGPIGQWAWRASAALQSYRKAFPKP